MRGPIIIDSHVHVGRNENRWERIRPLLERVGIDTAVLSADPESYDLIGDRSIGGDLARPGGPYGLWYIGGNPFGGYRRAVPLLPPRLSDYDGVEWHCYFTESYDYGRTDEVAFASAQEFLNSSEAQKALEALEIIVACGLPIRLTESFGFTLALAERFAQAIFIIPHMGLRNGGVSRVLNTLADRPHVYFDTSIVEPNEGMVERVGFRRVLLGSDIPTGDPARAVRDVRNLNLAHEKINAILGENARRLFERKTLP
ncbi:MAG: amidohydrolase family protein [Candidatus Zipacnadales bacterium]